MSSDNSYSTMIDWGLLEALQLDIDSEIIRAIKEHGHFASPESGIAVIRREFEELWDAFWKNPRSRYHVKTEAIQVAAMCLTLLLDWFPIVDKDGLTDVEYGYNSSQPADTKEEE